MSPVAPCQLPSDEVKTCVSCCTVGTVIVALPSFRGCTGTVASLVTEVDAPFSVAVTTTSHREPDVGRLQQVARRRRSAMPTAVQSVGGVLHW